MNKNLPWFLVFSSCGQDKVWIHYKFKNKHLKSSELRYQLVDIKMITLFRLIVGQITVFPFNCSAVIGQLVVN